jgi:hypothetical protein
MSLKYDKGVGLFTKLTVKCSLICLSFAVAVNKAIFVAYSIILSDTLMVTLYSSSHFDQRRKVLLYNSD